MKQKQVHKILILIVEDNKYTRELYRDVFEKNGFEVVMLENAEGFFPETVNDINPDVISMDLMLGDATVSHDGFEAMRALKSDLRTADIPIIVLTNFIEEGRVQRAKELGAIDFINLSAFSIQEIPRIFARYLRDRTDYKPVHPAFRKEEPDEK